MTTVAHSTDTIVDDVETTATPDRVVDGFTELLNEVDSEEIAEEYRIGIRSDRIDFEEHAKIDVLVWVQIGVGV